MNCPACTSPLEPRKSREGLELDVCRTCRGTWFDAGEFDELRASMGDKGSRKASLQDQFVLAAQGEPQHCPRCVAPSLLPGSIDATWLAHCSGCGGIFLSATELQSLRSRVHERNDNWFWFLFCLDDLLDGLGSFGE